MRKWEDIGYSVRLSLRGQSGEGGYLMVFYAMFFMLYFLCCILSKC
jgi:hypothetical protein